VKANTGEIHQLPTFGKEAHQCPPNPNNEACEWATSSPGYKGKKRNHQKEERQEDTAKDLKQGLGERRFRECYIPQKEYQGRDWGMLYTTLTPRKKRRDQAKDGAITIKGKRGDAGGRRGKEKGADTYRSK